MSEHNHESGFTVSKQSDGSYRWTLFSSTAFQDRDGEIVSQKALEDDVDNSDASGYYGPLRWWHVGEYAFTDEKDYTSYVAGKGIDIGDCDFRMMSGRVLIESGTFRSKEIAETIAPIAGTLESSIRYAHPSNEPDADGVFTHVKCFERSLLPKGRASNRFTKLFVQEDSMATKKEKEEAFKKIVGEDVADKILLTASNAEKEADAAGVASKEDEAVIDEKAASTDAGDYLVVEKQDGKADVLHLQVSVAGKPDHKLMGAAHAALMAPAGFRGNPYAGPNKAAAIAKLKTMYTDEGMTWPEASTAKKEYSFYDITAAMNTALREAHPNDDLYVSDPFEEYFTYSSWKDSKTYAQKYEFDDTCGCVTLDGDPVEVTVHKVYTPVAQPEAQSMTDMMASMKEIKELLTTVISDKEVHANDTAVSAKEAAEAQLKRVEALEKELTTAKETIAEMQGGLPRGIKALQGLRASQSDQTILKEGSQLSAKEAGPMIDPDFVKFAGVSQ